jgi:hypothetical protein
MLEKLKQHGSRIVVFVRDGDVDYYRGKFSDENVIVEPILYEEAMRIARSNRLSAWFNTLRRYMLASHRNYANPTTGLHVEIDTPRMAGTVAARVSRKTIVYLASIGRRAKVLRRVLAGLESCIFPGKMYDKYFDEYDPEMLIISSLGNQIDPYFMRAAKRHQCKIVAIPHSWDNTSGKAYRGGEPNHVVAWNDIMKQEAHVFHDVPEERIFVGGIAHWDFYFNGHFKPKGRHQFLSEAGLLPTRKIIFYGTSSPRLFPGTFDVIEGVLAAMQQGQIRFQCQLVVRVHFLEIERHPIMDQLTIAGRHYPGNARENALNTGTFAPRSSRRVVPMSKFEIMVFDSLDLFDFVERRRLRRRSWLPGNARAAFTSALTELVNAEKSTWKGTGAPAPMLHRLKLFLRFIGIYVVLRGGVLTRLIPHSDSELGTGRT